MSIAEIDWTMMIRLRTWADSSKRLELYRKPLQMKFHVTESLDFSAKLTLWPNYGIELDRIKHVQILGYEGNPIFEANVGISCKMHDDVDKAQQKTA